MHPLSIFAFVSLFASTYASLKTSTVHYGYCWETPIIGSATRFIPGVTYTSSIPTPTTAVLTHWIFQEGNPPPKRRDNDAPQLPARTAAPEAPNAANFAKYAKRYPPLVNRDDVDADADADKDLTVIVTQVCTSTITLGLTRTHTVPDPTITASTTRWATTITEWVTATSYCGPNNINC